MAQRTTATTAHPYDLPSMPPTQGYQRIIRFSLAVRDCGQRTSGAAVSGSQGSGNGACDGQSSPGR